MGVELAAEAEGARRAGEELEEWDVEIRVGRGLVEGFEEGGEVLELRFGRAGIREEERWRWVLACRGRPRR